MKFTCNDSLPETQNCFRADRSCIDHIFSLITILRNRKWQNKETYLCFIDFRRAFDSVNHVLLFNLLSSQFGIVGRIYKTLSSLYSNPITRVILTSSNETYATDYLECPLGVKQGCNLSPTLFSMFVHNLTIELEQSGVGISLDLPPSPPPPPQTFTLPPSPLLPPPTSVLVNHLIYADDIVCIAQNEGDLQLLLNIVNS